MEEMGSGATRIYLCGRLRVELAGEAREERIQGRQGRLLLAFLVLNRRRPVARDELIEALWAENGAPPSDGALSPVLSRLRRALAPVSIYGREGIVLTLPEPAWVDVEAADAGLAFARGADRPVDRLRAAREAAALVEPGVLPGHEAPWLREQRASAERLRVEALEIGADAARKIDPALAEHLAREAVAASPFRESASVLLIQPQR
jgi:DNA-binding SARP family transcriptional activator